MLRISWTFGFCFFTVLSTTAQEFAFAPGLPESANAISVGGYKQRVVQKVFDDLIHARGDIRMQKPSLILSRREGSIASFNPDLIQVTLDEKAYDICAGFGKDSLNALAALLGHELIHYYENHDWKRHFARENVDLETTKKLEKLQEGLKQETQADCLGGFLAFSVGYNTYGIMPEFLKRVYKAYDFPDELPGYPSLDERLKLGETAMSQLKDLQMVFETGNLLSILGNYAEAAQYHRFILQTYQSREIYNNAGVNAALAALALFDPTEMPYVFPLELDPKSRLYSLKNNDQEKEIRKNALLKSAQEHFERAILLDETYGIAYLNKACVYALRGEWEDADYALRKGKKKQPEGQVNTDFLVLEGIIAALQHDSLSAVKLWESAKNKGNVWAKMNLDLLQHAPNQSAPAATTAKGLEEIEQFPIADFLNAGTPPDRQVKVADKVYCGIRQFQNSCLYIHYANLGKNFVLIQETQASYTGRTLRGIGMGDKLEKLMTIYGKAPRTLALPEGSVWVYPESNLFFRISPQSSVTGWGVYRRSGT